jgi:chromosome segregation ATPase
MLLLHIKSEEIARLDLELKNVQDDAVAQITQLELDARDAEKEFRVKSQENEQLLKDTLRERDTALACQDGLRTELKQIAAQLEDVRSERDSALVKLEALELAASKVRCQELEENLVSTRRTVDDLRTQYEQASAFADEQRQRVDSLVEAEAIARDQRDTGVRLVRANFEGRVAQLEELVATLRAENDLLLEKDRRTNDAVRQAASELPNVQAERDEWRARTLRLENVVDHLDQDLRDYKERSRSRQTSSTGSGTGSTSHQSKKPSVPMPNEAVYWCKHRDPQTRVVCIQQFPTKKVSGCNSN